MSKGFFAVGIYNPKTEVNVGSLIRSAHSFGAAFVFTVGSRYKRQSSDTTKAYKSIPLFHFSSITDLVDHLPHSCQLVGVEQVVGAIPLNKFAHPPTCAYLLGAEDYGLQPKVIERCHRLVEIPACSVCLNVACAGSIVVADRILKQLK